MDLEFAQVLVGRTQRQRRGGEHRVGKVPVVAMVPAPTLFVSIIGYSVTTRFDLNNRSALAECVSKLASA
jgi:hypothetical protein